MTSGYLCIKQVHQEEVGLGVQDIGTLLLASENIGNFFKNFKENNMIFSWKSFVE